MDLKDIRRIVELMDQHGLTEFKLEQDETKLELKKGGGIDVSVMQQLLASQIPAQPAPVYAAAPVAGGAPEAAAAEPAFKGKEIVSPMVGTFYLASAPDAEPFVKVGSKIKPDSTVCIVEAMKFMNEIKSEISGEIVEILVENGTPVQYGEPLFRVIPD